MLLFYILQNWGFALNSFMGLHPCAPCPSTHCSLLWIPIPFLPYSMGYDIGELAASVLFALGVETPHTYPLCLLLQNPLYTFIVFTVVEPLIYLHHINVTEIKVIHHKIYFHSRSLVQLIDPFFKSYAIALLVRQIIRPISQCFKMEYF